MNTVPFDRWRQAIEKRDRLVKDQLVRWVIQEGKLQGFDLTKGDKAFIHPADIPRNCILGPGDPVISSTAPAVVPHQILFAKAKDIPWCLESPAIITPKTVAQ